MSKNLGLVRVIGADAVGQPGQRRFRIFAQSTQDSLIMWIEKQDLNSLSLALDNFLANNPGQQATVANYRKLYGAKP